MSNQIKEQAAPHFSENKTMQQYLADVKTLVDNITVAGTSLNDDDIILYNLNGLPTPYQAFKTVMVVQHLH